jgi:hypothetical protein
MTTTESYINERLDHLGIVGACAKRLVLRRGWMPKTRAIESRVSVGTSAAAIILKIDSEKKYKATLGEISS